MKPLLLRLAPAAILTLTACSSMPLDGPSARAEIKPTEGNTATGWVRFAQTGSSVMVTAELSGLSPNAEHGFHVHEKGDCSAPDGMSAGGHFNPGNKPHGHQGSSDRHAGDLPNLKADAQGVAKFSFTTDLLSVKSGATSVIGRSVVVHRNPDDYRSQPAGNSGPRIACGAISGT